MLELLEEMRGLWDFPSDFFSRLFNIYYWNKSGYWGLKNLSWLKFYSLGYVVADDEKIG